MARAPQPELRLRITVVTPPAGVAFRMQRGRFELADAVSASADELVFEFPVTVADAACTPPRFTGPLTQGPADGRFVYINVGTSAGQHESPWTRRIKVPLYSIAPELVAAALSTSGAVLETKINGIGRDGTPACATVRLLEPWALATARYATFVAR
jgi:hypothetical protein